MVSSATGTLLGAPLFGTAVDVRPGATRGQAAAGETALGSRSQTGTGGSGMADGGLPPAFRLTLSTASFTSSERVVLYGRPGSARTDAADATTGVADTDPARMLDRKMAEGRKELAALQIRQTKVAAKDAGVLSLLNPAGGLAFAKDAAKTLTHAMDTFGEAEKTIRRVEDESVADTAPEEVTAIAHDVYERTTTVEVAGEGRSEIDAALARRSDTRAADADRAATAPVAAKREVSTRVEALSIVRIEDDSNVTAKAAGIEAARSQRMGADAEVIKDGVSCLRFLDQLIALSSRRLQETGQWDARTAQDAAAARRAWHDAVAATAVAALPVVKAGYSIVPDDGV